MVISIWFPSKARWCTISRSVKPAPCLGYKRSSLNPALDSLANDVTSYWGNRGRHFLLKSLNCHGLVALPSNMPGWHSRLSTAIR